MKQQQIPQHAKSNLQKRKKKYHKYLEDSKSKEEMNTLMHVISSQTNKMQNLLSHRLNKMR